MKSVTTGNCFYSVQRGSSNTTHSFWMFLSLLHCSLSDFSREIPKSRAHLIHRKMTLTNDVNATLLLYADDSVVLVPHRDKSY